EPAPGRRRRPCPWRGVPDGRRGSGGRARQADRHGQGRRLGHRRRGARVARLAGADARVHRRHHRAARRPGHRRRPRGAGARGRSGAAGSTRGACRCGSGALPSGRQGALRVIRRSRLRHRRQRRPRAHVPEGDRAGQAPDRCGRGGAGHPHRCRSRGPRHPRRGRRPGGAGGRGRRQGPPSARGRRRGGAAGPHPGQPPPRRVHRQALRRPGDAVPRPHPGGEPRPHAGGREVRPHEGLQVLDLRDVVDPPGHHPGHRRPGQDDPHPGPHGRDDQQGDPGAAGDAPAARAGADHRGAGGQGRPQPEPHPGDRVHLARPAVARLPGGGGGRLQPERLHPGHAGGLARRRGHPQAAQRGRAGGARGAERPGAPGRAAPLRARGRPGPHPGGGRSGVRRHQGADPPDRVEDVGEAPPPAPQPEAPRLPRRGV
ncbi:MAG: RNA polymerase sigma factor RpoD, partial [uncultured Acidimicrobiales bacterium]